MVETSILENAHDVMIYGNLNNIQGDYKEYGGRTYDQGYLVLRALFDASSPEAMHNAIPQQDVSPITEHCTRLQVTALLELKEWTRGTEQDKNIIGLHGPPHQISTISQSLIPFFYDGRHRERHLAATFFFDKDDTQRSSAERFVATIAYHGIGLTEWQWRRLVVEPIMAIGADRLPFGIIIVDSLCQCDDSSEQVLNLISSCGPDFPIAFLVTSSSERHVAGSLCAPKLAGRCRKQIDLDSAATL
ncbi:hypothetical protein AX16_004935 [Volvariella volvacea WC 439]|nr:hypothetical protein AX16_004935 [Volvariella volvacea WC 439]